MTTFTRDSDTVLDPSLPDGDSELEGIQKNSTAIDELIADLNTAAFGVGDMLKADNLSGLASTATSQTNLGISAFAQTILDDADAAAVRTTIGAGTGNGDLSAANNLSDVASASTALSNLGGEPADADILKSDTTATLTVGYTETPSAYSSGSITVSSGQMRTVDTTSGVTIGLISGNGSVRLYLTGGGTVAYDAGYDYIFGEYDSSKGMCKVEVENNGTHQMITFVNSES